MALKGETDFLLPVVEDVAQFAANITAICTTKRTAERILRDLDLYPKAFQLNSVDDCLPLLC